MVAPVGDNFLQLLAHGLRARSVVILLPLVGRVGVEVAVVEGGLDIVVVGHKVTIARVVVVNPTASVVRARHHGLNLLAFGPDKVV